MASPGFGPTAESCDVRLFDEHQIPWDEIAFKVIRQTLDHFLSDRKKSDFPFQICDLR
jgi:hypothetical protein